MIDSQLEKTDLTLGIVPLTDCAPIAVAVEKGFFAAQGLSVTTSREGSWAGIRDKIAFGVLDAAQMIAPMTLSTTLGLGGVQCDMVTALSLGLNGNAITLSSDLFGRVEDADPEAAAMSPMPARGLKRVIEERSARNLAPLTFGVVFPISTHNYELRYWLASSGIDPDHDVNLVVIPPPQMAAALKAGHIAGYCVGEPWNTVAVADGFGRVAITKHEIWNNSPEKVLGVTRSWARAHPSTHRALIRALVGACTWLDERIEHRLEAAAILAQPQYIGVDEALIAGSIAGNFRYAAGEPARRCPDFNVFHRYAANFPWRSHAAWFLSQMQRWGQVDLAVDAQALIQQAYRPDIYRGAAAGLDLTVPQEDYKNEGFHDEAWTLNVDGGHLLMGPDRIFDGERFVLVQPAGSVR